MSLPNEFIDIEQIDIFLKDHSPSDELIQSNKSEIANLLNTFQANNEELVNAKLRRRITRFIQLTENPDLIKVPIEAPSPNLNTISNNSNNNEPSPSTDITTFIKLLSEAKGIYDVQCALNSFTLQAEYNQLDNKRELLIKQLKYILSIPSYINKHLKRRIERLVFVISTDTQKEQLKAAKVKQAAVAKKVIQPRPKPTTPFTSSHNNTNNNTTTNTTTKPTNKTVLSLSEKENLNKTILNSITKLSTPSLSAYPTSTALESELSLLTDLHLESAEDKNKETLLYILSVLLSSTELEVVNAKVRRRLKRIIDSRLSTPDTATITNTATTSTANATPSSDIVYSTTPLKPTATGVTESKPDKPIPAPTTYTPTHTTATPTKQATPSHPPPKPDQTNNIISSLISKLKKCPNSTTFESLLLHLHDIDYTTVSLPSKTVLTKQLTDILDNRRDLLDAKTKRKVNRLIDRITGNAAKTVSDSGAVGSKLVRML